MPEPTIVLVHGAWADASSWNAVASQLQGQGFTVLAPTNLLRGIVGDSGYVASFLAQRTSGPVVLVGHSYGGFVTTTAGAGGAAGGRRGTGGRFCPPGGGRAFHPRGGPGRPSAAPGPPPGFATGGTPRGPGGAPG